MKNLLKLAAILLLLGLSFFGGAAWKHSRIGPDDRALPAASPEALRLRSDNAGLVVENRDLSAELAQGKAQVAAAMAALETHAAEEAVRVRQAVLSNLRTIHSARLQFLRKTGQPAASLQQLAQLGYLRGNWVNVDAAVAGEEYAGLPADPAKPMIVKLGENGPEVRFDPADAAMMALAIVPGMGPNQDGTSDPTPGEPNAALMAPDELEKTYFAADEAVPRNLPAAALQLYQTSRPIARYLEVHPGVRSQLEGVKGVAIALQKDDGADPAITATLHANLADVLFRMNNSLNNIQRRVNETVADNVTTRQLQSLVNVLQKYQPAKAP